MIFGLIFSTAAIFINLQIFTNRIIIGFSAARQGLSIIYAFFLKCLFFKLDLSLLTILFNGADVFLNLLSLRK